MRIRGWLLWLLVVHASLAAAAATWTAFRSVTTTECMAGAAAPRPKPKPRKPGGGGRGGGGARPAAGPAATGGTAPLANIRPRFQYDKNNGYCGECSLQSLLLSHGGWVPQAYVRSITGGGIGNTPKGELLLGVNYDKAIGTLKVNADKFRGKGYGAFMAWAKGHLQRGNGVVFVTKLSGGADMDYDHIMPMVGATGDAVQVFSLYSDKVITRQAANYNCNAGGNKALNNGGCVPDNTSYGYAVQGFKWSGIGPRVQIVDLPNREPGEGPNPGDDPWNANVLITDLKPGNAYSLYRFDNIRDTPDRPTPDALRGRQPALTFTATAADYKTPIAFRSGKPVFFVCVPAAGGAAAAGATQKRSALGAIVAPQPAPTTPPAPVAPVVTGRKPRRKGPPVSVNDLY